MSKTEFKSAAIKTLEILKEKGFEGYLIGGSVRDFIMGLPIGDVDITTNATPQQVKQIFRDFRVIETGIKHGTVTVLVDKEPIEITTYRSEGTYSDNRHPDSVEFSTRLEDDVVRRDFTMNGVAVDCNGSFCDLVGGIEDIKKGQIRCIGDAETRFREDALRILRGIRFASVLGFEIEAETKKAIHSCRNLLLNISAERIREELVKLICGKNAHRVLRDYSDVIGVVIPEILPCVGFEQKNRHHCFDVYTHTLKAVENSPNDALIRLAILFHDIGKPLVAHFDEKGEQHYYGHPKKSAELTEAIMTRLRFDNDTKNKIITLVAYHDSPILVNDMSTPDRKRLKKIMSQIGSELIYALIEIKRCDNSAQELKFYRGDDFYKQAYDIINDIIENQECFSVKSLEINGNDLIALGYTGAKIGEKLNACLDAVINDRVPNSHKELIEYCK